MRKVLTVDFNIYRNIRRGIPRNLEFLVLPGANYYIHASGARMVSSETRNSLMLMRSSGDILSVIALFSRTIWGSACVAQSRIKTALSICLDPSYARLVKRVD